MTPKQKEILWAIQQIEDEGEQPVSLDSLATHLDEEISTLIPFLTDLAEQGYVQPLEFEITSAGKAWLTYNPETDDDRDQGKE